ncbi:MAG: hypothetical protein ABI169_16900 [Chitinophagaceae bacterium]
MKVYLTSRIQFSEFLFILLTLLIISLLQGCAIRSLYIPVSQNAPLFDSNKTIVGCAYLGTNHVELQGAYNPTKRVAVAANINFGGGIAIYDLALGTYGHNRNQKWRYELFAGYGYNSNITFPTTYSDLFSKQSINYEINSLYNKFYVQPAFGYFGEIKMYRLNYSFSLSSRFSYLNFSRFLYREIDVIKTIDPDNPVYIINRSYINKGIYLFEPCITNKVGINNLSGILQLQAIIPYSEEIDLHDTKFSPGLLFSVGLQYRFQLKKRL